MARRVGRSPLSLKSTVVWVTGASRGIGREIAKQFSSAGCVVALSARSIPQLKSLEKEITVLGGRAKSYPCDVRKESSVFSTLARIVHDLGTVDVLVNNAGITSYKSFRRTSIEEFDRVIATDLRGAVVAIKAVIPHMVKKKNGWIVNILSTAALKTFTHSSAYSAAKAGLHALGKVVREESRKDNIRVTNVFPGPTDTGMWSGKDRRKHNSRMMKAKSVAEAVLGVYQMPPDVVVEEIVLRPPHGDIDE